MLISCLGLSGSSPQQQQAALQAAEAAVHAETFQTTRARQPGKPGRAVSSEGCSPKNFCHAGAAKHGSCVSRISYPETNMFQDTWMLSTGITLSSYHQHSGRSGLYTIVPGGDISKSGTTNPLSAAVEHQYLTESDLARLRFLSDLAYATGGNFFHNSNDLDAGSRAWPRPPEYFYTLGFSPQNLKLDGSYHSRKFR